MNIPPGKLIVVNSKAVMNGEHSVPKIYENENHFFEKLNALDMENTYCEGEGATVAFHEMESFERIWLLSSTILICSFIVDYCK